MILKSVSELHSLIRGLSSSVLVRRKRISVHGFCQLPLERVKANQDDTNILLDLQGSANMTTLMGIDFFPFSSFVLSRVPT